MTIVLKIKLLRLIAIPLGLALLTAGALTCQAATPMPANPNTTRDCGPIADGVLRSYHGADSSAAGDASAALALAQGLQRPANQPAKPAEIRGLLRIAGELNNPVAQCLLGAMLAEGLGGPADPVEALEWFRRSALRGHPYAQFHLGVVLASGEGGERNPVEAKVWLSLASHGLIDDATRVTAKAIIDHLEALAAAAAAASAADAPTSLSAMTPAPVPAPPPTLQTVEAVETLPEKPHSAAETEPSPASQTIASALETAPTAAQASPLTPVSAPTMPLEPVTVPTPNLEPVTVPTPNLEPVTVPTPNLEPVTVPTLNLEPVTTTTLLLEPAPAPQPVVQKAKAPDTPSQKTVLRALKLWAEDWAAGRVDAYLSHYGRRFVSSRDETRKEWEQRRRKRLIQNSKIQIRIEEPRVTVRGDRAAVSFTQRFESTSLRSVASKKMIWRLHEDRWKIEREESRELE
jgi:hypothetical protein